jgi:hypothetical protein
MSKFLPSVAVFFTYTHSSKHSKSVPSLVPKSASETATKVPSTCNFTSQSLSGGNKLTNSGKNLTGKGLI